MVPTFHACDVKEEVKRVVFFRTS
jgi:hypothetical protein